MARRSFPIHTQHLHWGDATGWRCKRVLETRDLNESTEARSHKEEGACRSCWWKLLKQMPRFRFTNYDFPDPDAFENDSPRPCASCGGNFRLDYLSWRLVEFYRADKTYCSKNCVERALQAEREKLKQQRQKQRNLDRQKREAERQEKRALENDRRNIARWSILADSGHFRKETSFRLGLEYKAAHGNTEPLASNPFAAGRSAQERNQTEDDDGLV